MPGSRIHPALSDRQAFALITEAQSAQNLMRDAVDAIRSFREPTIHSDATFTLGSIGVEKTAKIMLGCAAVESEGRWPAQATLKTWGHDIDALVARLLDEVEQRQPQAVATGYAASLIDRIRISSILPLLFASLSRYGRSGRFHYLDILATDEAQRFDAPQAYWDRLENQVAEQVGGVRGGTQEEFERLLVRVSLTIAYELDVWWFAMHRLGIQGCFGELGRTIGWQIWPPGRPDPLRRT